MMLSAVYTSKSLRAARTTMEDVPAVYFVVLAVYTMLPVHMMVAVGMGAISAISQLILAGLTANIFTERMAEQVTSRY